MENHPYADATFYNDNFTGVNIDASKLDDLLNIASEDIDYHTLNRIIVRAPELGIEDTVMFSDFQRQMVKKACCAQAEWYSTVGQQYLFDRTQNITLSEFEINNGGKNGSTDNEQSSALAPRAKKFLLRSGLMNRGIRGSVY